MHVPEKWAGDIFTLASDAEFNEMSLKIFHYQYDNNIVYQEFCRHLNHSPASVHHFSRIPFMPVSFFKSHRVSTLQVQEGIPFMSSGTGQESRSIHHVADPSLYRDSFLKTFTQFYGDPENYIMLALLPSYLTQSHSSLVYMVDSLIQKSAHPMGGFFLDDWQALHHTLQQAKKQQHKTLLLGVSYALLDFTDTFPQNLSDVIVMETGGMKGMKQEITREELHARLATGFGVEKIHSEYGMTELLSQAYSQGDGWFRSPPWMKVLIRDGEDPLSWMDTGNAGGISIIDLANIYSCSFLATQDVGISRADGRFSVLGRFDNSDVRGCNLMAL